MSGGVEPLLSPGSFGTSPLYKAVKAKILARMTQGEWARGEALPSEAKLAARFDVSIGTVRKAIDELVAEKLLVRHQGRGTFIAVHNEDRALYYFFHLVGPEGAKEYPVAELVSFARARADAATAERLRIARGAPVFRFRNRLLLQGRPVQVDLITVPQALYPGLDETTLRNRERTIYALYQSHFGINVIRAEERLRARGCDAETAPALELKEGEPVLEIQRVAYTFNDVPVETRVSRVNTARHDYLNELG
jgi:GntR family transcriptional regulator